jgi:hypothetical protein
MAALTTVRVATPRSIAERGSDPPVSNLDMLAYEMRETVVKSRVGI